MSAPKNDVKASARPVLEVRGLEVAYPVRRGFGGGVKEWNKAVKGLDLRVMAGRTLALVGESGCGKSSTGRALCGLGESVCGQAWFKPGSQRLDADSQLKNLIATRGENGVIDLLQLKPSEWKPLRRCISLIFQDSATALNPKLSVAASVAEPLEVNNWGSGVEIQARVAELFELVEVDFGRGKEMPSVFSGGQRQRLCIARALALMPDLIICDEIVSALDVVVQQRILELLTRLQRQMGTAFLFISHDLAVVSSFADEVAVMNEGEIVETGPVNQIFSDPQHACTRALLSAVPVF